MHENNMMISNLVNIQICILKQVRVYAAYLGNPILTEGHFKADSFEESITIKYLKQCLLAFCNFFFYYSFPSE